MLIWQRLTNEEKLYIYHHIKYNLQANVFEMTRKSEREQKQLDAILGRFKNGLIVADVFLIRQVYYT